MFKRHFIAGILIWLPIWVTVTVVKVLFELFDQAWASVPLQYQPSAWLGFHLPGMSVIFVCAVIWLTGVLGANFMGRRILALSESILKRIPLVRSIYNAVQQALTVILSSQGESFRQVLLIEYPRIGIWSIAFKTNRGLTQVDEATGKTLLTVFVPTTPNPTSGFLLLVPEESVKILSMSVEAALKYIVSLGTVLPGDHPSITQPHHDEVI
ncbi:MAG: hypothetical protein CMF51_01285 [Legionellales bacterium]|nr:hypothetical protein [Legionellales bacterium]